MTRRNLRVKTRDDRHTPVAGTSSDADRAAEECYNRASARDRKMLRVVVCCVGCGRDTDNETGICTECTPQDDSESLACEVYGRIVRITGSILFNDKGRP